MNIYLKYVPSLPHSIELMVDLNLFGLFIAHSLLNPLLWMCVLPFEFLPFFNLHSEQRSLDKKLSALFLVDLTANLQLVNTSFVRLITT